MRKNPRRTWIRVAAGLVASALVLTACGGTGSGSTTDSAVLTYGMDLNPGGGPLFDPILASKSFVPGQGTYSELIYDRLIYFADDGSLSPGLIEKWETPDELTLDLTLRAGVKFQDGTDFDAEAVKFNWDRGMAAEELSKSLDFKALESIEVVSPLELRLKYTAPVAGYAINTTFTRPLGIANIASPTAIKKYGDEYNSHPVGAGPYAFEKFVPGEKLSLTKFDGYWDPGKQHLDRVEFVQTARGSATVSALAAGRIDIGVIDIGDVETVKKRDGLKVESGPGDEMLQFIPNIGRPPFNNLTARQGLAHALDPKKINEAAYAGMGIESHVLFWPGSIYNLDVANPYPYDPGKAKELLREGGVKDGTSIKLVVQNMVPMQSAAEVIQAQLAEVGITVEIEVTQNLTEAMNAKPDSMVASSDVSSVPMSFLSSTATWSFGNKDPEFDAAFAATLGATDDKATVAAYGALQQQLLDTMPLVNLVNEPVAFGMSEDVSEVTAMRGDAFGPIIHGIDKK